MKKIGLLAAIAALLCGFLIYTWMSSVESRVSQPQAQPSVVETVSVVTAASDISPNKEIKAEQLKLVEFPADYAPENAARSIDEVKGLYSKRAIYAGELIYANTVMSFDELNAPLSYSIPDGMRAMTIPVSSVTGVGGYITQGDIIDLLAYYETEIYPTDISDAFGQEDDYVPEASRIYTDSGEHYFKESDVSFRVLEGVEVLRVDTPYYENDGVYGTLTLLLTQEQYDRLNLVVNRSGITLTAALRPRDDRSEGTGFIGTLSEVPG